MARILIQKQIGNVLQNIIQCDDFDFSGINAPANANTVVQLIKTSAPGVFTTLGWYAWSGTAWVLSNASALIAALYPSAITLAQIAVPSILVPSGTVATNGVVTLGTALPAIYPQAWVYLPAGAVVGGLAGLYYCAFTTTTAGQVFTNYSAATANFLPAAPTTALVAAVGSNAGYTTVTAVDSPLATITVPGLVTGVNGRIRITRRDSVLNNVNVKTAKFTFGGVAVGGAVALASVAGSEIIREIQNRGSAASQFSVASTAASSLGSGVPTYTTVNTAVDQLLSMTANLATATDYAVLEAFSVEVLPA